MRAPAGCVRCGGPLRAPGLMSSAWWCEQHGEVAPLHVVAPVGERTVETIAGASRVPTWLLAPAPVGWTLGGIAHAGDDRATTAVTLAWSGPAPLGGPADLLLVAEEPGVGLGARYAGVPGVDAGECVTGRPADHVEVDGHPVPLWSCEGAPSDRTAFVGEAWGSWLWLVLWPAGADPLFAERLVLADARARPLPYQRGAPSPRIDPGPERPHP